jgi:hypothetical protein
MPKIFCSIATPALTEGNKLTVHISKFARSPMQEDEVP